MITVKLPDGSTAKFPDGTPPETMRTAIQKRFPPQPASTPMPAGYNPANVQQLQGKVTPKGQQPPARPDLMGSTASTISGFVNGIPILGPMVQNTSDALVGVGSQLTGGNYQDTVEGLRNRRAELAAANPIADVAGNIAGNISTLGLGATTKIGAEALGLAGKFIPGLGKAALSNQALYTGDQLARGVGGLDALGNGVPLLTGALPNVVAKGAGAAINALGRKAAPLIGSIKDASGEAARRVGLAMGRDARANPGMMLNAADEATAKGAGLPLVNVDRGGETVRALSRSVANQSPEARAIIEKTASDRFAGQGGRASNFVQRMAGGNVDDLAMQQGLKETAKLVNRPAYDAAMNHPKALQVWNPEIIQMFGAPAFRNAVKTAETRAANRSAVEGFPVVKNPFVFGDDGSVTLKPGATPNLRFWDQVKRNLDGMIDRTKDRTMRSDLVAIKAKLVSNLDTLVPQYKTARSGAAAFFGAEDALEAGKKFATTPKLVPEAKAAFLKFAPAERKAFQAGYASELIDRIKAVGDRSNVINQVFKTPASREMIELVFGKGKARELEAYIRVEDIADKLRGAMGNSTTARQLMEMGIGAGTGAWITGGDWKGALAGAGLAKGARYLGQKVDDKVMQEVAKLLLSNDPALIQKAVYQATMSEQWMLALEVWGKRLDIAARGAGLALAS